MDKILLIEDQRDFQMIVERIFRDGHHEVTFADNTERAKQALARENFDLILLDISLPDKNGLDFYCELKNIPEFSQIPVIFLTGTENVSTKVTAFSLGADDYILKTSDAAEFKARVTAKLRKYRASAKNPEISQIGPFKFNLPAQRVYIPTDNTELNLTPREFKLLYLLAKNTDVIYTREKILNAIWGNETFVSDRTVDAHIYQLRKKLGPWSTCIEAISNVGYRLVRDAQPKKQKAA